MKATPSKKPGFYHIEHNGIDLGVVKASSKTQAVNIWKYQNPETREDRPIVQKGKIIAVRRHTIGKFPLARRDSDGQHSANYLVGNVMVTDKSRHITRVMRVNSAQKMVYYPSYPRFTKADLEIHFEILIRRAIAAFIDKYGQPNQRYNQEFYEIIEAHVTSWHAETSQYIKYKRPRNAT